MRHHHRKPKKPPFVFREWLSQVPPERFDRATSWWLAVVIAVPLIVIQTICFPGNHW